MTDFNFTIREGSINDLPELQQLFVDSITTICVPDYNSEQIKVWIASTENKQRWLDLIYNQILLVAIAKETIVGFCSLQKASFVDMLYIHKDYQGLGIARKLYTELEREAIKLQQNQLSADVSKTARPFFEKMGFKVFIKQTVKRQGIELTNFKMIKTLIPD